MAPIDLLEQANDPPPNHHHHHHHHIHHHHPHLIHTSTSNSTTANNNSASASNNNSNNSLLKIVAKQNDMSATLENTTTTNTTTMSKELIEDENISSSSFSSASLSPPLDDTPSSRRRRRRRGRDVDSTYDSSLVSSSANDNNDVDVDEDDEEVEDEDDDEASSSGGSSGGGSGYHDDDHAATNSHNHKQTEEEIIEEVDEPTESPPPPPPPPLPPPTTSESSPTPTPTPNDPVTCKVNDSSSLSATKFAEFNDDNDEEEAATPTTKTSEETSAPTDNETITGASQEPPVILTTAQQPVNLAQPPPQIPVMAFPASHIYHPTTAALIKPTTLGANVPKGIFYPAPPPSSPYSAAAAVIYQPATQPIYYPAPQPAIYNSQQLASPSSSSSTSGSSPIPVTATTTSTTTTTITGSEMAPSSATAKTQTTATPPPNQTPGAAASSSSSPSTLFVHVDAGHIFQVHVGDKIREILGPATVKIVNNDTSQPVPLQLTAPPAPGQLVQQIVDENGMLVHLIIKSSSSSASSASSSPSSVATTPLLDPTKSILPTATAQIKPPNHLYLPKTTSNATTYSAPPQGTYQVISTTSSSSSSSPPPAQTQSTAANTSSSSSPVYNTQQQPVVLNTVCSTPTTTTTTTTTGTVYYSPPLSYYPAATAPTTYPDTTSISSYNNNQTNNDSESNTLTLNEPSKQTAAALSPISSSSVVVFPTSASSSSAADSSSSSSSSSSTNSDQHHHQQFVHHQPPYQQYSSVKQQQQQPQRSIQQQKAAANSKQNNTSNAGLILFTNSSGGNNKTTTNSIASSKSTSSFRKYTGGGNQTSVNGASAPVVVKSATANSFYNVSEQSANFISPDNAAAFVNNRYINTNKTTTSCTSPPTPLIALVNVPNNNKYQQQFYPQPQQQQQQQNIYRPIKSSQPQQQQYKKQQQQFANNNESNIMNSSNTTSTVAAANTYYNIAPTILPSGNQYHPAAGPPLPPPPHHHHPVVNNAYPNKISAQPQLPHHQHHHHHYSHPNATSTAVTKTAPSNSSELMLKPLLVPHHPHHHHHHHHSLYYQQAQIMAAEDLEIEPHLDFFAQILSGLKKPQLSEIEARSVLVRLEPIELEPFLAHEEQQIALHLANSTGDAVSNNATNDSNGMKEEPATSINGASSDLVTGTTSTTTATSASRIFTPNIISKFQNLIYTLELSCNSSINVVYTGDANEITLKDLEPATAYRLRVFAALPAAPATIANAAAAAASTTTASASSSSTSAAAAANSTPPPAAPALLTLCRGEYTQAVSFETRACEPAQPEPPKAWPGAKKKNELGVRWQPPVDNGSKIVSYTLEYQPVTHPISEENGVEEQLSPDEYTVAYRGAQKQFIVKKLTPSTLYAFRLQAENGLGASAWSSPTLIYTAGCVPEAPPRPQLLAATTSTLTLGGWTISSSASPLDYELQMHAVEDVTASAHGYLTVCNGPMEAYDVRDLKRAMGYLFRVRAKNDEGYSLWSEVARFRTNADVPRPPIKLKVERTKFQHYRVQWEAPRDDGGSPVLFYTLEICSTEANSSSSSNNIEAASTTTSQASSPSGFYQCIYKGGNCEYTISATVAASPPTSPLITPPTPTSPTTTSTTVIQPGHTYLVRCSAHNAIGASTPSDPPTQFTSAAIAPGPCSPPKLVAKAKAHSAVLKWYAPESNGGSEVVEYELRLIDCHTSDDEDDDVMASATQRRRSSNGAVTATTSQDRDGEIVYRGSESQTMVNGLAPGRLYRVQVRAANKVGWGEWSPEFEFTSGAGCPDAPNMPLINSRASNSIQISWNEPNSNGSAITEFRLEWSLKETGGGSTSVEPLFTPLYTGPLTRHELKSSHFLPSTRYLFRVQALNVNGSSAFSSPPTEFLTPPAVPSMVASMRVEQTTSESIRVSWKPPQSNGSPILFYNLDFGEVAAGTSATIVVNNSQTSEGGTIEYTLDMLQPDTSYKMRIQAANSVGIGPFSNLVKVKTKALAPQPPHIELISTTYNSIKLKWTSIIPSQSSSSSASATVAGTESGVVSVQQPTQYNLEMALIERAREEEEMSPQFRCVYRGPANTYKASKLLDSATYAFRIAAANDDAGQGRWSAEYRFTTARSPPLVTRPPSVLEIGPTSCLVEWMSAKHVDQTQHDALEYCLQVQSRKDSDYREIYRGSDCSYRLRELDPNTEYSVRVCAYLTTEHMCAPYSPHTSFQTPKVTSPRTPHHISSGSNNTLQQKKSTGGGDASNSDHRKKSSPSIWSTLLSALMFKPTSNSSPPPSTKESSPSSSSHHHHHQAKTARELGKLNGALNKYGGMSSKKPPRAVESSSSDVDYYERTPLWTTSDQYWAMCFILALVLVAFVIACVVNSVYTNYYAVVIPDSPTKSPTADL